MGAAWLCIYGGRLGALRGYTGFLHFAALPWVGIVICLGAAIPAFLGWTRLCRSDRYIGRRRLYGLCAMGLLAPAMLALSSLPGTGPGSVGHLDQRDDPDELRIVQANVLIDNSAWVDAVFARLPAADAVVLAEASAQTVHSELVRRGLAGTYRVFHSRPDNDVDTLILVRATLQPQPVPERLPYAAVGVRVELGERSIRLIGVHTASPVARSLYQSAWVDTVSAAVAQCRADSLVAGDFNAVRSQLGPLTGCLDAAGSLGVDGPGSWPSTAPRLLGARIDHQIYDPARVCPVAGELFDVPGSDHRGTDFNYSVSPGDTQKGNACTDRN